MRDDQLQRSDPALPGLSMALGVRETMGRKENAAVMQVSSAGLVFFVNSNMAALLSRERAEIEGHPFEDFDVLPWARGILKLMFAKVKKQSRPFEIMRHYLEPDSGRSQYWRLALFPTESDRVHIIIEEVTQFQKLRETFEKFVSREVIDLMIETPEHDFLRPERRVITVLFGDLRGFTAFSASQAPDRIASLLADFLGAMIAVVKKQRGTVDKVVGDEIMALFGAPVETTTHALDACRCAQAMQERHRELRERWRAKEMEPLGLGIGLAAGEVVVGNVGSAQFMNYTAIGHTVNVAARLCGKAASGEILMPLESAKLALSQHRQFGSGEPPRLKKAGEIAVKGVAAPVPVARLVVPAAAE